VRAENPSTEPGVKRGDRERARERWRPK